MNKLTCKTCGYERNRQEPEDYECAICGGHTMVQEFQHGKTTLNIPAMFVEALKRDIEEFGGEEIYKSIESFGDATTRARYRLLFVRAGGEVPESEIIL